MTSPRLLTLMGSGETSPTMVKTHRALLERLDGPAMLLDTPYGFQMNADDLSARTTGYFADSVGTPVEVVSYRTTSERGTVGYEQAMARLREAAYVFAGPGSPSYALRQWSGSAVPDLLREKLRAGGAVTFASAAALTLGSHTVPVYEVYKVGEDPRWLDGLDLLAEVGLQAAVIPHYDNAEGGNHDTRYCYLGEQRLASMEASLPEDTFVLGVDEHTGVVIDLDERSATVVGRGVMTIRAAGRSARFDAGSVMTLDDIVAAAVELRTRSQGTPSATASGDQEKGAASAPEGRAPCSPAPGTGAVAPEGAQATVQSPMLEAAAAYATAFDAALRARRPDDAVQAVLDLEAELRAWSADPTQSDEIDRARTVLRSLIVRLGEVAATGARDPREVLGPFVEALLGARDAARAARRFDDADALRDQLAGMGVVVQDTLDGTEWSLAD